MLCGLSGTAAGQQADDRALVKKREEIRKVVEKQSRTAAAQTLGAEVFGMAMRAGMEAGQVEQVLAWLPPELSRLDSLVERISAEIAKEKAERSAGRAGNADRVKALLSEQKAMEAGIRAHMVGLMTDAQREKLPNPTTGKSGKSGKGADKPHIVRSTGLEYQDRFGRTLKYRLAPPPAMDAQKRYPLVLCMHGAGGRGSDNMANGTAAFTVLVGEGVYEKFPCYVLAPQCPNGKRWVEVDWGPGLFDFSKAQSSSEMDMALELVDKLIAEKNIDPARVYVTGQSMGGAATWYSLYRRPDLFAAAIPICGVTDPSQAGRIKHIPVWTFHGTKDTVINPVGTQKMVQAMQDTGATVKYNQIEGGHIIWGSAYAMEGVWPWLFSQQRKRE